MPKNSVGEHFCAVFRNNSGSEEIYGIERRNIKIFRQIVFVSQCRKLSKLNLFVLSFSNFPVAKKIMDKGGVSTVSVGESLSYSAGKIS